MRKDAHELVFGKLITNFKKLRRNSIVSGFIHCFLCYRSGPFASIYLSPLHCLAHIQQERLGQPFQLWTPTEKEISPSKDMKFKVYL